jgi:hypothetical protein
VTVINDIIERDRAAALKQGGKATVGRVTIIPAFNGRGMKMDERKRLTREVGGEARQEG